MPVTRKTVRRDRDDAFDRTRSERDFGRQPVHPDVRETLPIDEHGGLPSVRIDPTLRPFGRAIDLGPFELRQFSGDAFEFAFKARRHIIDFNFTTAPSDMRLNGGPTRQIDYGAGTISFAPAGTELYRRARAVAADTPAHRIIGLILRPAYLESILAEYTDGRPLGFVEYALPERWPVMDRIQSALEAVFDTPGRFSRLTVEALAHDISVHAALRWSSIGARLRGVRVRAEDTAVSRALDFIHANLKRPVTLADIAVASGRGSQALIEAFQAATGHTPYHYLVTCRIRAAAEALRRTKRPTAAVAEDYAFASASHFSNCFKRIIGVSPSTYRRS
ncbi:MAG: AraC family transcriptional regulator [Pseudomonadota bacterium]